MTVWQSLTTSLPPHNNHQEIRRWQDGDSWKDEGEGKGTGCEGGTLNSCSSLYPRPPDKQRDSAAWLIKLDETHLSSSLLFPLSSPNIIN